MKSPLGSDEPTSVVSPLKGVICLPDCGCDLSGQVRVFVGVRTTVDTSEVTRCAVGGIGVSMVATAGRATGISSKCVDISSWSSLPCGLRCGLWCCSKVLEVQTVKELTCQQGGK